jgi:hypothetical protein
MSLHRRSHAPSIWSNARPLRAHALLELQQARGLVGSREVELVEVVLVAERFS